jgi:hypothetical protein
VDEVIGSHQEVVLAIHERFPGSVVAAHGQDRDTEAEKRQQRQVGERTVKPEEIAEGGQRVVIRGDCGDDDGRRRPCGAAPLSELQ